MTERVLYLLAVVGIGWAVTIGLRSVPFLLFAGKDRELPRGVEKFGAIVSPIIIFGLIVYSYSGLEWRTPWPYLAGLLTIALQLVVRNSLASILAGTILYMCILNSGCASQRIISLDADSPSVSVSTHGVKIGKNLVSPAEVVEVLQDNDIPYDRVIHIRLEPDVVDLSEARNLMGFLCACGYKRPVLVKERHSESFNVIKKEKAPTPPARRLSQPEAPKRIRYKGSSAR